MLLLIHHLNTIIALYLIYLLQELYWSIKGLAKMGVRWSDFPCTSPSPGHSADGLRADSINAAAAGGEMPETSSPLMHHHHHYHPVTMAMAAAVDKQLSLPTLPSRGLLSLLAALAAFHTPWRALEDAVLAQGQGLDPAPELGSGSTQTSALVPTPNSSLDLALSCHLRHLSEGDTFQLLCSLAR